jgi:hypothetical protein
MRLLRRIVENSAMFEVMDCVGFKAWLSELPDATAVETRTMSLEDAQLMLKSITESSLQISDNAERWLALRQCFEPQEEHDSGIVSLVDIIGQVAGKWLDSRSVGFVGREAVTAPSCC